MGRRNRLLIEALPSPFSAKGTRSPLSTAMRLGSWALLPCSFLFWLPLPPHDWLFCVSCCCLLGLHLCFPLAAFRLLALGGAVLPMAALRLLQKVGRSQRCRNWFEHSTQQHGTQATTAAVFRFAHSLNEPQRAAMGAHVACDKIFSTERFETHRAVFSASQFFKCPRHRYLGPRPIAKTPHVFG